MADGLPVGRLVAVRQEESGAAVREAGLEPGRLRETLTVDGQPLTDLLPGTRLRIGAAVVVEVARASEFPAGSGEAPGGLQETPSGLSVPARVVAGGTIRVGDAVIIEAVPVPLAAALDLHPFRPEEISAVVTDFLDHARAAGLDEVRIIHGRGRGVQRETVRRLLGASPLVSAFRDAPPERGGWGATVVRLRTSPEREPA